MYLLKPNDFNGVCSFLSGLRISGHDIFFSDFSTWLTKEFKVPNNLIIDTKIMLVQYSDIVDEPTPDQNIELVDRLFELLKQFIKINSD